MKKTVCARQENHLWNHLIGVVQFTAIDWRLDREIGRGAYGVVYVATNGKGERAAVKVCRREEIGEERYARELRGAKLYGSIPPQEGLVRVRELAEEPWGFYVVMDLADNEFGRGISEDAPYRPKTLASVIAGEKALPLGECIKLGTALAKGLAALQRHHLLHRDIKPGNVIYVGGRPVLTDPGLVVEEDKAASLVGTPGYVPPEKNFTDAASDIYSLGLTLKAASFGRCVEDLKTMGPAPEADTDSRFFMSWWRMLNKATDEDPRRRYQSAKALLRDLAVLRSKMALESLNHSCLAKVIVSVAFVFVAVWAYPGKIIPSRDKINVTRAKRETLWSFFMTNPYSGINGYYDEKHFKDKIDNVAKTSPVRAAEMQSLIARMTELDEEIKTASEKVRALRKTAKEKVKKGLDDKEEYLQAQKISEERQKLSKTRVSIADELNTAIEEFDERVKRDSFWDTYTDARYSHNVKSEVDEILRKANKTKRFADSIKRDIAEIEAVDKEKSEELQLCFDKFLELDAKVVSLYKELDELHKKADEQVKKGLDDTPTFLQATGIADEMYELSKKLKHIVEKLSSKRRSYIYDVRNKWSCYFATKDANVNEWKFQHDVEKIAAVDKAKAEELQSCFNRLAELLSKHKALVLKISMLRNAGEKKTKQGTDDMMEFLEAKKIYEEECKLYDNEIKPCADELNAMWKRYVDEFVDEEI